MITRAPRVLLLVTQSEMGGAQRYVLTLALALRDASYRVVVACGEGGELIDVLMGQGIETKIFPALVRDINARDDIRALCQLVRYLRSERFDLIHCNSTKAGIVGRIAARFAKTPHVYYTVHGCVLNEPMPRHRFFMYWTLEWLTALVTTRLIAVSQLDRSTLLSFRVAPDRKISVIPNGITTGTLADTNDLNQRTIARSSLHLPLDAVVVGTIANFYPTKALEVLIHATAIVADEYPKLRLVIIGDGPERPKMERLVRELGLGERVFMPGQIPDGRHLLPAFDQFVLASRKEGMPLALLEAMEAGLPVIVTNVGGMPEVVDNGQAGLIVPAEDPEELAAAILDVIANPDLARTLGRKAHERVIAHFTAQKMTARTIDEYPVRPPSSRNVFSPIPRAS